MIIELRDSHAKLGWNRHCNLPYSKNLHIVGVSAPRVAVSVPHVLQLGLCLLTITQ